MAPRAESIRETIAREKRQALVDRKPLGGDSRYRMGTICRRRKGILDGESVIGENGEATTGKARFEAPIPVPMLLVQDVGGLAHGRDSRRIPESNQASWRRAPAVLRSTPPR